MAGWVAAPMARTRRERLEVRRVQMITEPTLHQCSCGSEALHVWRDDDTGLVYLSTWAPKRYAKGWTRRLRHIWRIVTTGEPWDDEIVLTPEEAREVARRMTGEEVSRKF